MSLDIEKAIREYFPTLIHMSLATCVDNKPWTCEVHFAYDDDLNLYFRSKITRRHSQEIAQNPNVAGNIVQEHPKGAKVRGVYFEGVAKIDESIDDEDHPVYKKFVERMGLGPEILEDAKKEDGHKFYRITVSNYYVFDARESNPSDKFHLKWRNT
jgi:uncharacterized protein YhbP (UPF0306 family)